MRKLSHAALMTVAVLALCSAAAGGAGAAARSQVLVVSHAAPLVAALDALPGARRFTLDKRLGETAVEGEQALGWTWPER